MGDGSELLKFVKTEIQWLTKTDDTYKSYVDNKFIMFKKLFDAEFLKLKNKVDVKEF